MSAPYNSILQKSEAAMVALLTVNGSISNVYGGIASTTKQAPCVVCYAESANEAFPGSGNYKVMLNISVKSTAEPDGTGASVAAHQSLCASVFDWCKDNVLAADLTAAAHTAGVTDFCVQGVVDRGLTAGVLGDCWVDSLKLELYACAANLS